MVESDDKNISNEITSKELKNNGLSLKNAVVEISPQQMFLSGIIEVDTYKEVNGIEMGVLDDGTAFLGQRGLAAFCDLTNNGALSILSKEWEEERDNTTKERLIFIRDYLYERGYHENSLFIQLERNNGIVYAYPDIVCMAILEYYAFEAKEPKERAKQNFRLLARNSFREFIYRAVGYNPEVKELNRWKYFLDRVDANYDNPPSGFFSIFQEMVKHTHFLIKNKFIVNDKTIPDLSVGKAWGAYWSGNNLASQYGERVQYQHNYPDYYPQALSNPQHPWAYPNAVLPVFREWLENVYFASKFPKYLMDKVKQKQISLQTKDNILLTLNNMLGAPNTTQLLSSK